MPFTSTHAVYTVYTPETHINPEPVVTAVNAIDHIQLEVATPVTNCMQAPITQGMSLADIKEKHTSRSPQFTFKLACFDRRDTFDVPFIQANACMTRNEIEYFVHAQEKTTYKRFRSIRSMRQPPRMALENISNTYIDIIKEYEKLIKCVFDSNSVDTIEYRALMVGESTGNAFLLDLARETIKVSKIVISEVNLLNVMMTKQHTLLTRKGIRHTLDLVESHKSRMEHLEKLTQQASKYNTTPVRVLFLLYT